MNLFLSIATSGLPSKTVNKSIWCPRMCAVLVDESGTIMDSFAANIRAEGRHIESAATLRHGISTNYASRNGIDEFPVLSSICGLKARGKRTQDRPGLASCARALVLWNAPFVLGVIAELFRRYGELHPEALQEPSKAWLRSGLTVVDLQSHTVPWCRLAPADGDDTGQYRRPTRDEAAFELCGLPARPLPHSSDSNLAVERSLYAALVRKKAFEMEAA